MPGFPNVGSRIAGYVVKGVLGRGGMGVVFRAQHEILEREAAVKVLLAELSDDPEFRTRFLRESKMAARLSRHPNVLPVYDAGESDGLLYLAMYLVDGPSLAQVLREGGPLPSNRAVEIVRQVAGALDVAHAQGLVHRDVKPANILIEPRPGGDHSFLGDFGLLKEARSTTGLTSANVMVGTLDYMAPEQLDPRILGGEPVDGRVDVYALGCVMYECLTGSRPFADVESDTALIVAHLSRQPPRVTEARPDLPAAIDEVVARAMAKDRDERPASAVEFADDAARVLAGSPAAPPAPAPPAPLAPVAVPVPTAAAPPHQAGATVAAPPPPRPAPPSGPPAPPPDAPSPPGRRRRSLALLVGIPILVVAVVVAVILATSGGGGGGGGSTGAPTTAPPPRAPSVWVTGGTTLTRFDPETGRTIARISVGGEPVAVAVDASAAWVTNNADGTVTRIDPATNEVVATIDVGQEPSGIASDGTAVWVSLRADNSVARIDPTTNAVVAKVRVGEHPEGIAVDAHGVWVACYDDALVARVDPATSTLVTRVKVGENPTTAVLAHGSVWLPAQLSGTIAQVDPANNKLATSVPAGPQPIDVAFAGPFMWVVDSRDQHRIFRIEIDTQRVQAVSGFGDLLHVTSGTGLIWVSDTDHDDVEGLNPTDGSVQIHLRPKDEPAGIAVG